MHLYVRVAFCAALAALTACGGGETLPATSGCAELGRSVLRALGLDPPAPQVFIEVRFAAAEQTFLEDLGVPLTEVGLLEPGGLPAGGGSNGMGRSVAVDTDVVGGGENGTVIFPQGQQGNQPMPLVWPGEQPPWPDTSAFTNLFGSGCFTIAPEATQSLQDLDPVPGGHVLSSSPVTPPGALAFNRIDDVQLGIIVQALRASQNRDLVVAPPVLLADGQNATVMVKNESVPVAQIDPDFAPFVVPFTPQITMVTTGPSVNFTPVISADRRYVRLDLLPIFQTVTATTAQPFTLNGSLPSRVEFPIIRPRVVSTQVMIDDGQTVVIGGLHVPPATAPTAGLPFLGDLPILPGFVRQKQQLDTDRTLFLMITARIIIQEEE